MEKKIFYPTEEKVVKKIILNFFLIPEKDSNGLYVGSDSKKMGLKWIISNLSVAILLVGGFVKLICYCFLAGRFKAFNISRNYITVTEETIMQGLMFFVEVVVLFLLNLVYVKSCVHGTYKKIQRRRKVEKIKINKISILTVVEALLCLIYMFLECDTGKMFKEALWNHWLKISMLTIVAVVLMNFMAIEAILFYNWDLKRNSNNNSDSDRTQNMGGEEDKGRKYGCIAITCVSLLVLAYISGYIYRQDKIKMAIYQQHEAENIMLKGIDWDNQEVMYPIIYENDEIYIISEVTEDTEGNEINYENQMVISKLGVSTRTFTDVSEVLE